MTRHPVVAGRFYPDDPQELISLLEFFLSRAAEPMEALGLIAPHAGYAYSGAIAGETFGRVNIPERVVLLGPNHTGQGRPWAVYPSGSWLTPLGECHIDAALAQLILASCPGVRADELAHRFEHSLEVQLPFIQSLSPQTQIVPVCIGGGALAELLLFGKNLGRALASYPHKTLIVASSDMTHYEPGAVAEKKDRQAIERILALDAAGLFETVRGGGISMCGVLPVTVMIAAVRQMGATRGTLVHYGNSGDVTHDWSEVVGYAGVIIQ